MRFSILLCAFIFSLAGARAAADVQRYYRFETDGGAGVSAGQSINVADDSSGHNRHGAGVAAPTYAVSPLPNPLPGGSPNSFAFHGDAGVGRGVTLDDAGSPILGTTFTVETFFRLESADPNTGDVKNILRIGDASGGPLSQPFGLWIWAGDGVGFGTNDLYFSLDGESFAIPYNNLELNRNYHVAVTYDGTAATLYVDGAPVDSGAYAFAGTGTKDGVIGNSTFLNGRVFPGYIDEVRISDVALSPSQFLNVPEPGALALLLPVGVALTARRQRCA